MLYNHWRLSRLLRLHTVIDQRIRDAEKSRIRGWIKVSPNQTVGFHPVKSPKPPFNCNTTYEAFLASYFTIKDIKKESSQLLSVTMSGVRTYNAVRRCQDIFLVTGLRTSIQTKPRLALVAFTPIQQLLHITLASMPPKRTRITEALPEEPVPKRVLRSRGPHTSFFQPTTTAPKEDSRPKKKVPKKENIPHSKSEDNFEGRSYWLMKAEPETRMEKGKDMKFSIDDLKACKEPAGWDGGTHKPKSFTEFNQLLLQMFFFLIYAVRNYGARNNLKSMRQGDLAFFYHRFATSTNYRTKV